MSGDIGYGTLLRCGADSAAVTATVNLGGVKNIVPPSFTRDAVEVTHNASPGMVREFIGGLIDQGDLSGELIWDPVDFSGTTAEFLQMKTERGGRLFEISWPQFSPVPTCTFTGLLTEFTQTGEIEGAMMASFTIKPLGILTWANA
jgi:hypothetical protein